jgi:hypothetical protein
VGAAPEWRQVSINHIFLLVGRNDDKLSEISLLFRLTRQRRAMWSLPAILSTPSCDETKESDVDLAHHSNKVEANQSDNTSPGILTAGM